MRILVSYGGPDEPIASAIGAALTELGGDIFLFSRSAQAGKKLHRLMRDEVSRADAVLLVCSEKSLERSGVLNEIEEALQKEARLGGREILIPITLDDFVFEKWHPPYAGMALAIKDRVIWDFRNLRPRTKAFRRRIFSLWDDIRALAPNAPIKRSSIHIKSMAYGVCIKDESGSFAVVTHTQTFLVINPTIQLEIPNVSASGRMHFVECDIAEFVREDFEGGVRRIILKPKEILNVGRTYKMTVRYDAIDCYLAEVESQSVSVTDQVESISLTANLPESRPASQARLFQILDDYRTVIPGRYRRDGGCRLRAEVASPNPRATYVLEWSW